MRTKVTADNYIVFSSDNYNGNSERMFSDVAKVVEILTTNGYMVSFRYDDAGIYTMEFSYDDPSAGATRIYWLDDEQADYLFSSMDDNESKYE